MLKQAGPYRLKRELRADVLTVAYEGESADGKPATVLVGKSPVQLAPEDTEHFRVEVEASREAAPGEAPGIEPVVEHGVHHGLPWVAHRHRAGWSLAEKLDALQGGLPGPAVALIGLDLAAALEAAHSSDPPLLHRGLSLHNAILDEALRVRLHGVGLAGVALDGARRTPALARIVQRHTAPEMSAGTPLTPAVDLFALGVILVTLLRGEPHPGGAVKLAGLPLAGLLPKAPRELVALLIRLLDPEPAKRGTAADTMSALRHLLDDPEAERARVGLLLEVASTTMTERAEVETPNAVPDPTMETNLDDVLASMAPSRSASDTIPPPSVPAPPPAAQPRSGGPEEFDDPATIVTPSTEVTLETAAPSGYFEENTLVQLGGGTALLPRPKIAPPPGAPGDPAARTQQLDLAQIPDRGDGEPRVSVPQLEPEVLSPASTFQRWYRDASKVEVAGWPLPWIIGVGAVAVVMLFFSMVVGVWLAT
ncbi:MAG: hypothetical protein AB8I08_11910 [Sandaracinaceae bacterium]